MSFERRKGLIFSAIVHFVILLLIIFGLPSFLQRKEPPQPLIISVDILPVTDVTNVKTSKAPLSKIESEEPKEAEKNVPDAPPPAPKPEPPKPEPKPEPPKPAEKPEPAPEPKKEEKKPEPKKEEVKPEPKEKPKKATEADLEKVLEDLRKAQKKSENNAKSKEDAGTKVKSDTPTEYDPGKPLSMSELDAIRSQLAKCWIVNAGARDAENLIVKVRVQLAQDGAVSQAGLAEESVGRYNSGDSFYRAAADSAIRAVYKCSPLQNLPPEKYNTWRDIVFTFDPKQMLN